MENAVKALLIASGILLGIMILSLAVSLYSSLSSYVDSVQESIASKEIQAFNEQFLQYINYDETNGLDFKLSIQDVVTAANTAYENNLKNQVQNSENTGNNYRVTVKLDNQELENDINSKLAEILSTGMENSNGYKCTAEDIKISTTTGRVYEINFYTIS